MPDPPWKLEIEELHRFFEAWIGGAAGSAESDFERLEAALSPAFTFIATSGEALDRREVIQAVRDARAARPGLRIRIREPRLELSLEQHLLVTYQEWQDTGTGPFARVSTVIFEEDDDAPNGLAWRHLHETGIEDVGAPD